MATPFRLKRSAVADKRPTIIDLQLGELALNTYDGYLFAERDTGGVGIGTTVALLTPWTETFGAQSIYYTKSVGIGTANPGEKLHLGQGRIRLDEGWQITWLSTTGTQRTRIAGDSGSNFIVETGASNTERLRINSTGNVGINTSNPLARLSVGSGSINDTNVPVQISTPSAGGLAYYGSNNNGSYGALFGYDGSWGGGAVRVVGASDVLTFVVNNTTRAATITPAGNLGIGTTNPVANLHSVNSGLTAPSLNFGATAGQIFRNELAEFAFGLSNTAPFPLWMQGRYFNNTARDIVLNPLGGNIGVGTTNPGSTLDVRGSSPTIRAQDNSTTYSILLNSNSLTGPRIQFGQNADNSFMEFGAYNLVNNLDTKNRDLKIFSTSAPDAFILRQATGNIGIGTTNATNRLTVWGNNIDTTPILALLSGNDPTTFNNGAQIAFGWNGSPWFQHFIHTRHNNTNSNNAIDFYVSDGTQNNTLTSGSVHTMSLVSGSVGINSTSPTSRLDVVGNAKVSGVVTATTFIGQINAGVSTLGITTATTLSVSGVSTFAQISVGGTTGTNQYVLTSTGTGLLWQNVSSLEGITGVNITQDTVTSTSLYVPFVSVSAGTATTQYVSTNQFVFKPSTGSLGIGTANPTAKLYVNGDVFVTGITTSTDFDSLSDQNLKTNIETISTPLDKIQRIRGVNFDWKETQRSSMGVIAQEVEKVFPQLVHGDETKTVNYNGLIGLLIECIKEQQKEIDLLKEILKTDK